MQELNVELSLFTEFTSEQAYAQSSSLPCAIPKPPPML